MANVTLYGTNYTNVPAVTVPKTGGGTARFTDTSDTTATVNSVLSPATFYDANGVKQTGTAVNQGMSVVTTVDPIAGGDIVTITTGIITPYSPYGDEAEQIGTYDCGTVKLSSTNFNTWTPTTTATNIYATANLGTYAANMTDYEYFVRWIFVSNTAYNSGTTLKAAPIKQVYETSQIVVRRPSDRTNVINKIDNYNVCITWFTAPLIDYYNASGNLVLAYASGYGIYPSISAIGLSSNTSLTPTLTIKRPAYYARCSTTYFDTTMAAAVDKEKSTISCIGYMYRVKPKGLVYGMYHDIIDVYNI